MTKKALIEALRNVPENARILIPGYESGYSDIGTITTAKVALNYYNESYNGPHEVLPSANELVIIIERAKNPSSKD